MNRLSAVMLLILVFCSAASAQGGTARPRKMYDSIQMLIDFASPGDTVWVPPGEHHVSLEMKDGVALKSERGWWQTKLLPEAGSGRPIISCVDLVSGAVIEGFTFENGEAEKGAGIYCLRSTVTVLDNRFHDCGKPYWPYEGGGIHCVESSVTITNNRFHECDAGYGGGIWCGRQTDGIIAENEFKGWDVYLGGGILCVNSSPLIQDNTFTNMDRVDGGAICCTGTAAPHIVGNDISNCKAYDDGSGILCLVSSSPLVEGNTISECWSEDGGAICAKEQSSPQIVSNDIVDNFARYYGGGIACRGGASVSITENRIRRNESTRSGGGAICLDSSTVDITASVITNNLSGYDGAGLQASGNSEVLCTGNTFWGNEPTESGSCIEVRGTATVEVYNCIIAHSLNGVGVRCFEGAAVTMDCNDLWANASSYQGCDPGPNDFAEAPLFCFPTSFGLSSSSPCIDHPVCGLVGALGVECSSTLSSGRSVPTTWGMIKSMYR